MFQHHKQANLLNSLQAPQQIEYVHIFYHDASNDELLAAYWCQLRMQQVQYQHG